ncbi:MAG: Gfo/Idh/MocA family oxidoreductase [Acidimicrobiales bacterium]
MSTSTDPARGRVAVLGMGAVGSRVARQLIATDPGIEVVVSDADRERLDRTAPTLGSGAIVDSAAGDVAALLRRHGIAVLVVATPAGRHLAPVRHALDAGVPVVSVSDRLDEVRSMLRLDPIARRRGVPLLVGAGFAPGLTGLLARHVGSWFDVVDEIHMATVGTGGPACARQHHRALGSPSLDWRDGSWRRRPGGSGRELVWFPEPIGGADCYRAALPDAVLAKPWFPDACRITARMAATRQDRFTAWLPMLSPPHAEGGDGAVRVEVRGRVGTTRRVEVVGAVQRPAVAAATVAATVAELATAVPHGGRVGGPGARGLAGIPDGRDVLARLAQRGLTTQIFDGLSV